jgi:hypothetical protein
LDVPLAAVLRCIDAPDSASLSGDEEKNKAVKRCKFAIVLDRQ